MSQDPLSIFEAEHEATLGTFDEILSSFNRLRRSLGNLTEHVKSVKTNLPQRRRSSDILHRLFRDSDFPNIEKQFADRWGRTMDLFRTAPEVMDIIWQKFLPAFTDIRNRYDKTFVAAQKRYTTAVKNDAELYETAYANYLKFCKAIDQAHASGDIEFRKMRDQYEGEVAKLDETNEKRQDYGLEMEESLADIEDASKEVSTAVMELFTALGEDVRAFRGEIEETGQLIESINSISSLEDIEEHMDDQDQTDVCQMSDELPEIGVDVTRLTDCKQVFAYELSVWKGRMCCGVGEQLQEGDIVTAVGVDNVRVSVTSEHGCTMVVEASAVAKVMERRLVVVTTACEGIQKDETVLVIDEVDEQQWKIMTVFGDVLVVDKTVFE